LGDVHNPGSYPYDDHKSAGDYIDEAGGYDQNAMESMTYIVFPDGTARPVSRSWISLNSDAIPPGSVVFVPRDLFPIDWLGLTTTVATILQSFAVTAASLAVIAKD
jgi:protein involved in polysaccharide export with SLBB domain